MRYIPFGPELDNTPNIIVDGRGNDATVLVLSHWPRNKTPAELKADTSTGIVINYARSPERERYRAGAEAVSNNHFDVDGLMSMWATLNPDEALDRADALIATGECGDFDRWSGELPTKVTCALYGLENGPGSPFRGKLPGKDYLERTAFLYQKTLPVVRELFDDIDHFEQHWRAQYDRVQADRELFERGEATVQEVPELDLAIFELPRQVHDMALYERTTCSRVALHIVEHRYQVRYRYESWVELQSRQPPPRVDLQPFADLLQTFEGNAGEWVADDVQQPLSRLRLRGPEGSASPSSVTPGLFMRLLMQFLSDNASNAALLWSPHTADNEYLASLPSD
jgi:hypothetical protein